MNKLQELELEDIEEIIQNAEDTEKFTDYKYKILDLDGAVRAFKKLNAIEAKIKDIERIAQEEIEPYESMIAKINEWKDEEIKSFDRSINFFNFSLEQYYREQRELDPKFKLSTPYGKVSSRKQQDKWTYEDEKVIESLKDMGISHLIRTKEVVEVEKAELKKSVEILKDVVSLDGSIVNNVKFIGVDEFQNSNFVNVETGELEGRWIEYVHHKQAIVYKGQVIEGITVTEQPDSISIKVVE
ncbi:hypothetical protein CIW83_18235 [Tissierella sp. P1]|uniref:host-nuclease inhibitor Gam family protein n=1 Tax=Tissierella sp. P1 TaxID=1280483 RepID=UPI000BA1008F|nr:host-nuclease inhibitor Gam family protein [Tissierella sp. P1]OZV10760.1 hypothetical protein CIW83_18235 [Tissierella sp. P1]